MKRARKVSRGNQQSRPCYDFHVNCLVPPFRLLLVVFSNDAVFLLLHVALFLGLLRSWTYRHPGIVVNRSGSRENLAMFPAAYGAYAILVFSAVDKAQLIKGYELAVLVFDLVMGGYLCFFSSWGRNRITGFYVAFQTKLEK